MRVPWTARRSNHPKGNQSWVLLEGLMLKLKLQYFGQVMQRTNSLEKTLILRKIEGRGEGLTEDEMVGRPGVLQSMWSQRVEHDRATELTYVR